MPSDSRARLVAYLCQAGLGTARANGILDAYTEEITEKMRGRGNAEPAATERARCGFLHDQWDGPYKMSRRCIAEAGHTDGGYAYDHGPWEGVPDGGRA
ncbi:hypothetical protein [Streptomyces scopuliridis]|uniref:hypothetical protein n=1 Tax=Streptomyces scopuliridis TaxID=452529 RepID=UPI00343B68B2